MQVNTYPTISISLFDWYTFQTFQTILYLSYPAGIHMRFTFHLTTGDCFEAGDRKFFANIVLSFYFFCCTWLWWALKYGDWLEDRTFGLFILFSLFAWIYCEAKALVYITSVGPVHSACIWYQYWYQHW